jgi:hypothetical protein
MEGRRGIESKFFTPYEYRPGGAVVVLAEGAGFTRLRQKSTLALTDHSASLSTRRQPVLI